MTNKQTIIDLACDCNECESCIIIMDMFKAYYRGGANNPIQTAWDAKTPEQKQMMIEETNEEL